MLNKVSVYQSTKLQSPIVASHVNDRNSKGGGGECYMMKNSESVCVYLGATSFSVELGFRFK